MFVPLRWPFLGLKGSISIYLLMALLPLVLMSVKSPRLFLLIGLSIVVIGSQVFYENKREVIFMALLVMGLFALRFYDFRAYHVLLFMLSGIFIVLYMSLLRGYGGIG